MFSSASKAVTACLYRILAILERGALRLSPIPSTAFIPTAGFTWTLNLERSAPRIRQEIDQFLHGYSDERSDRKSPERSTQPPEWQPVYLHSYGRWWPAARDCPITSTAIHSIPDLLTAFVAILEPGGHVAPHRGLWRGQLRYILTLHAPTDTARCVLYVDGQPHHFVSGKGFMFDDGLIHSADNHTSERRVAVIVTVKRPFREPIRTMNRLLFDVLGFADARLSDSTSLSQTGRRFRTWLPGRPDTLITSGPRERQTD